VDAKLPTDVGLGIIFGNLARAQANLLKRFSAIARRANHPRLVRSALSSPNRKNISVFPK
jgi:hypothetical protein